MPKKQLPFRCAGSAAKSEDGDGPYHHCDVCGAAFSDAEIKALGGYFPEHRFRKDPPRAQPRITDGKWG